MNNDLKKKTYPKKQGNNERGDNKRGNNKRGVRKQGKKYLRRLASRKKPKLVEQLIKLSRVSKVTKGGKKLSFRVVIVVGDKEGRVGVGVAKADDVLNALKKAKADGRKNLIKISLTKSLSITHPVIGNFGACQVFMKPSIEGSGVIAGGAVRIVLEFAGIRNIIAKQLGSNNLLNNARASICALENLTTKIEVAKKRNLKPDLIVLKPQPPQPKPLENSQKIHKKSKVKK